jgi:hypothetical protein
LGKAFSGKFVGPIAALLLSHEAATNKLEKYFLDELAYYRHTKQDRASMQDALNLLILLMEPRGIEPLTS